MRKVVVGRQLGDSLAADSQVVEEAEPVNSQELVDPASVQAAEEDHRGAARLVDTDQGPPCDLSFQVLARFPVAIPIRTTEVDECIAITLSSRTKTFTIPTPGRGITLR